MIIICPACKEQMQDSMIRCVCGYEYDMFLDYDQYSDLSVSEIHSGSLIIKDTSIGYEIIIPPKQSGLIYIDNGLYIIASVVTEILSIISYVTKRKVLNLPETKTGLLFLMGVSFIFGYLSIYAWLWNNVGKEHIIMTRGTLIIKKDIYGYGRKSVYDLSRMRNLCVRGGSILFNYDSEKFRFGHSITEGEAQFIVHELRKRNPFRVG
jgi:hypothetical protein